LLTFDLVLHEMHCQSMEINAPRDIVTS